jgi:hypothetical protein
MVDRYFDKHPIIKYGNNNVVDITKRVALLEKVSTDPFAFYPYEITSNERADQLSYRYYEDPFKSWILYLGNKIVDPYYEWYLHTEEFEEYIVKKYGSYVNAADKIMFYRNDWSGVEDISVEVWNSLPKTLKNYWEPNFGPNNKIIGYKRKQVDWKTVTNKMVSYQVSNTNFIIDEIIDIVFDENNSGKGQISSVANNTIIVQHVSGTFFTNAEITINESSYVYGRESTVNTVFTSVTSVANNLSEEEYSYWVPVTYLEYENEKNEFNKSVRVIDSNLKQNMVNNLRDLLRE